MRRFLPRRRIRCKITACLPVCLLTPALRGGVVKFYVCCSLCLRMDRETTKVQLTVSTATLEYLDEKYPDALKRPEMIRAAIRDSRLVEDV